MKKTLIYLSIFIGFNILLWAWATWSQHQEVLMEADGFEFIAVSPQEVVAKAQKNTVFLIDDETTQTTHIYKITSQHASFSPSKVETYGSPLGLHSDEQLIQDAVNGTITFTEALSLDYEALKALVANTTDVRAMQAIPSIPTGDLFAQIDDSALIFLLFGFVACLLLSFYDAIAYGLKRLTQRNLTPILNILFLSGLCLFVYQGTTPPWYAASHFSAWLEVAVLLFASYLLFQWARQRLGKPDFFLEGATKQFILLFACITAMAFLGTGLAQWIDAQFFNASSYTGLAMWAKLHLYIGFGYAFTLGVLLKNSMLHWWTSKASSRLSA